MPQKKIANRRRRVKMRSQRELKWTWSVWKNIASLLSLLFWKVEGIPLYALDADFATFCDLWFASVGNVFLVLHYKFVQYHWTQFLFFSLDFSAIYFSLFPFFLYVYSDFYFCLNRCSDFPILYFYFRLILRSNRSNH